MARPDRRERMAFVWNSDVVAIGCAHPYDITLDITLDINSVEQIHVVGGSRLSETEQSRSGRA
jgi:hypothetical protein